MVKRGWLLTVLMLWLGPAWAATFEAQVDRHQLSIEEKLTLTLKLLNSDVRLRAEGVNPNIDLSVLGQDFDLGVPRADFRYNIYQGRGRSTSELQVELYPTRAGQMTIPAFSVGDASTAPIAISVRALAPDAVPEVFVRSGASTDTLWAGQQLVVYLDVYHRVEFADATFSDVLETEPTRIELMPHWQLPQDSYTTDYKGFRYTVERLAWAVFPDQPGTLTVQLPSTVVTTTTGRQQRLAHQVQTVTVKALPDGLPNNLIIGKPTVSQVALPINLQQHQLAEWTVTVEAPVAVTSLPDKLPLGEIPAGVKVYADRAQRDTAKATAGIVDKASYTLSVIGLVPGDYALAPIRVPYFDPDTGQPALIELTPMAFTVTPGPSPQHPAQGALAEPDAAQQAAAWWPFVSLALALLWLATLGMWAWQQRRQRCAVDSAATAPIDPPQTIDRHPLQQRLLEALACPTLEAGLLKWTTHHPEQVAVADVIRRVQHHCYGQAGDDEATLSRLVDEAAAKISRAAFPVHADKPDPWSARAFTMAIRSGASS